MNKLMAAFTLLVLLGAIVYSSATSQGSQGRYADSAAKFRACRGHRIEGTIGNDVVRLCVTTVP